MFSQEKGTSKPLTKEQEKEIYYYMLLIRAFEERVSILHRQGKILGGVYSGLGQEAIIVGVCHWLEKGDFVSPLHRDLGVFLMRGTDPRVLMAQFMGKRTGLSKGKDSFLHGGDLSHGVLGATSMLASTLPVAVGAALKFRIRKEKNVAIAFFGEGASSRGDFHEALNFAGIHKLPVVFVCENNFYAYSTPQHLQMAVDDVAIRAEGYGFKGEVTSGNDLISVLKTSFKAIEKARTGDGPTLIECKTYRYRGHSEHDPAKYRTEEELIEWESRDPIARFEFFLEKKGYDLAKLKAELKKNVSSVIDEAQKFGEESPYPEGKEAMEDIYSTPV